MIEFDSAILPGVGQRLEIRRIRVDRLERDDVLVRIMASGLCHTDLEVIEGALAYPMPIVLGHEGAGVVEAVGEAVTEVKPGDPVVCSWNPHWPPRPLPKRSRTRSRNCAALPGPVGQAARSRLRRTGWTWSMTRPSTRWSPTSPATR